MYSQYTFIILEPKTLFIFLEYFYDISKVFSYSNFICALYKIDFNTCRKNNKFQIIIMVRRTIFRHIYKYDNLHLNLSWLKPSILRFCNFFGDSHRAADVSIGFLCKYSDNQRKLQSQLNGFLPKCLKQINNKQSNLIQFLFFTLFIWRDNNSCTSFWLMAPLKYDCFDGY